MAILKSEALSVRTDEDVSRVRQKVRQYCVELGFSLVEQTKMVTAASELTRNILVHGCGEGSVAMEIIENNIRKGLRVTFEDNGPGIADIARALQDGFTTGTGLGLGLGGAKRLVNEFELTSEPNKGTKVVIIRWK